MSLKKAIKYGKEHRKEYNGAKSVDPMCRNHKGCKWCEDNRTYQSRKQIQKTNEQLNEVKIMNNVEENIQMRTLRTFVEGVQEEGANEPCKYVQFDRKGAEELLNYIDNIQRTYVDCDCCDRPDWQVYEQQCDWVETLELENKEYEKRIEKAIEVLKLCNSKCSKEVIDILRGKDEENKSN